MRITLEQAAQWCGGQVKEAHRHVIIDGACQDTRKIQRGQLFVALQAGQRDGHDFIPAAITAGAAAVLCSHCEADFPHILVEDTRKALGDIARNLRMNRSMKVVGVTGSVGKSTTKEMIATVLSTRYRVGKTPGNFNNDLGLPMAILGLPEGTEVAVLEMGMNHFGEMSYLTSIAQPNIAVITNIGTMHMENLGSRQGILQAKLEILEGLQPDGKVVLNGDEPLLWGLREVLGDKVTYFGKENRECQELAGQVEETDGGLFFRVSDNMGRFPVRMRIEGHHFVSDAMAAVTVGRMLDVDDRWIRESLATFTNMAGRQEIYEANGYTIIQDCYNAGPESMSAALNVLGSRSGRHIAVLGDMLELGVSAQAEHYRVGRIAATKADMIFALGDNAERIITGAITGGMAPERARSFTNVDTLVGTLKFRARPGDVILFKGSRGMHMERVLEQFLQTEKKEEAL